MLGLDPEGAIPLDLVRDSSVDRCVKHREEYDMARPISGDPFFKRHKGMIRS